MSKNQILINLRKFLGLSQDEFASSIGMTQAHYSRVESGKNELPFTAAANILKLYKVSPNWLFFGEGGLTPVFLEEYIPKKQYEQLTKEKEELSKENNELKDRLLEYIVKENNELKEQNKEGVPSKTNA